MTIDGKPLPLSDEQLLLRGSSLRNTEWIYGVVVYSGHESKIMMNSCKSKMKVSKLEKSVVRYLIIGIIIQSIVCATSGIAGSVWLYL